VSARQSGLSGQSDRTPTEESGECAPTLGEVVGDCIFPVRGDAPLMGKRVGTPSFTGRRRCGRLAERLQLSLPAAKNRLSRPEVEIGRNQDSEPP
jgi:hypothetical protein